MRLRTIFAVARLATSVVTTLNRDPEDIPEVLKLVNQRTLKACGVLFASDVGEPINPRFSVKGRGFDAENGGYPTCWVWCPNGYRFKISLTDEPKILAEDKTNVRQVSSLI